MACEARTVKDVRGHLAFFRKVIGIVLLSVSLSLQAEEIQLKMPNGLMANADFSQGAEEQPVVIILHGFLQTYEFPTVARLANSLREEEFTVLSPSLTLGIDHRKQSLSCEAIHNHNMADDAQEVGAWVKWLHEQTGQPVTLIGHSIGSLNLLGFMLTEPSEQVERLVLISLLNLDEDKISHNTETSYQRALDNQARGKRGLANYSLSFCERYPSEVDDFLSYRSWTTDRTITALQTVNLPTYIILGSKDERMTAKWRSELATTPAEIVLVEGAGHFFDTQYEFDLLDEVLSATGTE
jgi:pimeloyl-ACP methyl ester carboxylesterase